MSKRKTKGKYNNNLIIETRTNRSKTVAAILAILLGGLGIHKFYLGETSWGLIYFLFSWTFIPALLGLIEGVIYLTMSNKDFASQYS